MPKTFSDGSTQDYSRLTRITQQYHHELVDCGARVSITFVRAFDKDDEPIAALKFAGGTAYAVVKLVSQERKLRVPFDAEIKIDGAMWDDLGELQKDALLDHELTHVKVQTDAHGAPLMDDQQHVKLKLIPDDIILTGFLSVIRHFSENSIEYQAITRAAAAAAQEIQRMSEAAA